MFYKENRTARLTLTRCALCLLLVCVSLGLYIQPVRASAEITSFTAVWLGDDVVVQWETDSELDNSGFYIQRSDSQNGVFVRITDFFTAEGDALSGASYVYLDTTAATGNTYWYKLEIIDLDEVSEYYGPISVAPPTPTLTATIPGGTTTTPTITFTISTTLVVSPTSTQVQSNPTAYPAPATATLSPVQPTAIPLQSTQPPLTTTPVPVITATQEISPTAILSATATLLPLPDITLTFPAGGIVIQSRGTATITPAPTTRSAGVSGWNPIGSVLLISVIVLIWILLGAWFYLSFRKIE